MHRNSIYYVLTAISLYILACCISCSKTNSSLSPERKLCDSIISAQYDTIFVNPQQAIANLTEAEAQISDSCLCYRIEMYKSLAFLFMGDEKRMDSIRRNVALFLSHTTESKELYSLKSLFWNHTAVYRINSLGDRDSAIACFKNAYIAAMLCNEHSNLVNICINLADAYRQNGDAAQSSGYYRRALALADSMKLSDEYLSIYNGLGQVYSDIENYTEANRYFEKARSIINDTSFNAVSYDKYYHFVSYGNCLYFQKRYNDALSAFKSADSIAATLGNIEFSFITHVNLGEVMLMMSETDSAYHYLKKAQEMFNLIPKDASKRFYLNSLLGDLEMHRGNMHEAIKYLFLASADSLSAGPRYLALHYSRMQAYYSKCRNYERAYSCLLKAQGFLDSINNNASRNQITEIDYRYRQDTTRLHTNLIISQKDDRMKSMQIQLYILFIILILSASVSTVWIMYKHRKQIEEEMQQKTRLFSLRLSNMRNRITPHFMFNMLNNQIATSDDGINNLARLLRMNLEMCDRYTVTLSEELEFIDSYMNIERLSLGNNFVFNKHIDSRIDPDKTIIPAMMAHIFVENAVKHGLRSLKSDRFLNIDIRRGDDVITISVENNCKKTDSINNSDHTGTGLRIVTQTIQTLNEYNKRKISLNIETRNSDDNTQTIWKVTLSIPDGYNFIPFKLN